VELLGDIEATIVLHAAAPPPRAGADADDEARSGDAEADDEDPDEAAAAEAREPARRRGAAEEGRRVGAAEEDVWRRVRDMAAANEKHLHKVSCGGRRPAAPARRAAPAEAAQRRSLGRYLPHAPPRHPPPLPAPL
jgi:hypothetical protein